MIRYIKKCITIDSGAELPDDACLQGQTAKTGTEACANGEAADCGLTFTSSSPASTAFALDPDANANPILDIFTNGCFAFLPRAPGATRMLQPPLGKFALASVDSRGAGQQGEWRHRFLFLKISDWRLRLRDIDTGTSAAPMSGDQQWNFVSAPDLHPMKVTVNVHRSGTARGKILITPYTFFGETMIGQTGALMMRSSGDPVWFLPLASAYVQNTDLRVQKFHGKPVLTMWQGTISGTQSADLDLPAGDPEPGAFYLVIDQSYRAIKRVSALNGFTSDLHEFSITERDTGLFTAVKQVAADLTPYGGPADGYFDDYSVQEVDLETGQLVFFWDALEHVNPAHSYIPASSTTNNIWDLKFHQIPQ